MKNTNSTAATISFSLTDEAKNTPRLSVEEQNRIFKQYQKGGADAAELEDLLVKSNLRLVLSMAGKYVTSAVPFEDLVQEGAIGLLQAVRHFDLNRDVAFSAYAGLWIKQALNRCYPKYKYAFSVPQNVLETRYKIQQAKKMAAAELGVEPTVDEISAVCGIPSEKIEEILRIEESVQTVSLEELTSEENSGDFEELVKNEKATDPCEYVMNKMLQADLAKAMEYLTPQEKHVICLLCGLYDGIPAMSMQQIADLPEFGVSRSRIHQIKKGACDKLYQNPKTYALLADYLE